MTPTDPSSTRIGIIGEPTDAEVAAVARGVTAAGAEPVVVDLSAFPAKTRVAFGVADGVVHARVDGADVSDVAAWYVRRYGFTDPLVREPVDADAWADLHGKFREWCVVEQEKAMFVSSFLHFLGERAPVVNPAEAFTAHLRKPHQVHQLRKAGLPVPDDVWTNDVDVVRAFLDRHGRAVYKPQSGPRHVLEITREMLDARGHALATEPILVQALAGGDPVRVYVAGDRVAGAARVLFDASRGVDYRESQKGAEPVTLPDDVARDCVRAARATGMAFTGVDVMWDANAERHAFLECNPAPMFVNFERATGLPVTRALVDLLLARAGVAR